jgi:xylulokinase
MAVIGLDVGTSGVKSTVFDGRAAVIAHAYREYDLIGKAEGRYELDPQELWEKARQALRESAQGCGLAITAITVTSFGESFVCLDEGDNPLANTMIYMDKRGLNECREYTLLRPEKEIFAECGQYVDPMFALYKLRWMSKHRRDVLEKTKKLCFIADYITYKLGAAHKCDYSLAARSAMFNVFTKRWIDSAVEFSAIDRGILPQPVPSGSVVGRMSAQAARDLGMSEDTRLIIGGHDQILAALGSGAWEPGDVANGMGTVDCITAVMSADHLDMDALLTYNLPVVPFMDSGHYVTYAFNISGGCIVKWFRDTFAKDIAGQADAYAQLNAEAPEEPTGILVLPYLAGGGTPYMDGATPAAIAGLRLGTSRGKLFRAFLEGETYEMMLNIECLSAVGIDVRKVITVGGGSNSALWMQIRADVFDRAVYLPKNKEAGTLASAMLCYTGIGIYPSVRAAQDAMIAYEQPFLPQPQNTARYRPQYEKYKKLYLAIRDLYAD